MLPICCTGIWDDDAFQITQIKPPKHLLATKLKTVWLINHNKLNTNDLNSKINENIYNYDYDMLYYTISNHQTWHGRWAPNAEHSASKSSLRSVCATALTSPSLNTWSDLIAQTFQHASWMFHGCFPTNLLWHLPLHIFKSIPSAACASSSRLMLPEPSLSKTLWHSWHEATRDVMSNTAWEV